MNTDINYMQQVGPPHCMKCHQDHDLKFSCPMTGTDPVSCPRCNNLNEMMDKIRAFGQAWKYCPHCGKELN